MNKITTYFKESYKELMEKGLKFAIREGGRTVGAGQVTEILK